MAEIKVAMFPKGLIMKTYNGAAMDMNGVDDAVGVLDVDMEDVPAPADEALSDLIAEHCDVQRGASVVASVEVAHFCLDLYVHCIESQLRRLEMRGQKARAMEAGRLIQLARTVRRKLSNLHNETGRISA
ncbi:MAG: hypothetical protein JNK25_03540 [Phycisphaerae bacterium]|nr:hypothetical protein [Phycisphaerae bacterium]